MDFAVQAGLEAAWRCREMTTGQEDAIAQHEAIQIIAALCGRIAARNHLFMKEDGLNLHSRFQQALSELHLSNAQLMKLWATLMLAAQTAKQEYQSRVQSSNS
jgi:hypothetical protein